MVKSKLIQTILKLLEKYLIRENRFQLRGDNYDLILFTPTDRYSSDTKYSLLVSAKTLNRIDQKKIIIELLKEFKEALSFEEYNSLSRINVLHSENPLVKNLKLVFGFREQVIEINDIPVGGVNIEYALLLKSLVLDKLIDNNAIIAWVTDKNGNETEIPMGIHRIEESFDVVYYTGKGLREMFKPMMTDEEMVKAIELRKLKEAQLIDEKYMAIRPLNDILKIN